MKPSEQKDKANKDHKNCKYEGVSLVTKMKLSFM